MGEPIARLNPKIESRVNRDFIALSVSLLLSIAVLLKPIVNKNRGKKPYDYRILMVLCILRIRGYAFFLRDNLAKSRVKN